MPLLAPPEYLEEHVEALDDDGDAVRVILREDVPGQAAASLEEDAVSLLALREEAEGSRERRERSVQPVNGRRSGEGNRDICFLI